MLTKIVNCIPEIEKNQSIIPVSYFKGTAVPKTGITISTYLAKTDDQYSEVVYGKDYNNKYVQVSFLPRTHKLEKKIYVFATEKVSPVSFFQFKQDWYLFENNISILNTLCKMIFNEKKRRRNIEYGFNIHFNDDELYIQYYVDYGPHSLLHKALVSTKISAALKDVKDVLNTIIKTLYVLNKSLLEIIDKTPKDVRFNAAIEYIQLCYPEFKGLLANHLGTKPTQSN